MGSWAWKDAGGVGACVLGWESVGFDVEGEGGGGHFSCCSCSIEALFIGIELGVRAECELS